MDTRKRLNLGEEMPQELQERKAKVLATLKELQNEVAPLMKANDALKDSDSMKDSKTFLNVLQKEYDFKSENIQSVYKLAKYLYECGNYHDSTCYLYFCLLVMSPNDKVNLIVFSIIKKYKRFVIN